MKTKRKMKSIIDAVRLIGMDVEACSSGERLALHLKGSGVKVKRVRQKYVEAVRKDGLRVFFDVIQEGDPDETMLSVLNDIRLNADADTVIMAVGVFRGMQIARNYAEGHNKSTMAALSKAIRSVVQNHGYRIEVSK